MLARIRAAALALSACAAGWAHAQVVPPLLERPDRPGGPDLEAPPRPTPVPPPLVVPPAAPGAPGIAAGLRVFVRRIEVTGSTVFSDAQLRAIVAPFEGRELTSEDLDEVRHRVSAAYVNAGYINSGALLPDQEVADGVVRLQAVEGRLTEIELSGEHHFRRGFITGRIERGAGPPLNVRELQQTIQILLQNPQIERINAELAPGVQRGEATLRVDVREAPRWLVGAAVANNRSPAVGSIRGEVSAAARNALGQGEALTLRAGRSRGLEDAALSLAVPLTSADTALTFRGERVKSRIVEPPFDTIDVRSESSSLELGVSHPLVRTVQSTFSLGAGVYHRDNATTLLGVPFSFVRGIEDGNAKVSALRLSADWLDRTQDTVLAARLTVSHGLRAFGATTSTENTPDSQFTTALVQVQWARRLAEDGRQILLRADSQSASGELLPSEKFAIGGAETVRGYRENLIVRDKGWLASAEYRHPVWRDVWLAAFVDAGRAWDYFGGPERRFIWSAGPGVRWDLAQAIHAELYWGWRGKEVSTPGGTLQDRGLHFRVAASHAF